MLKMLRREKVTLRKCEPGLIFSTARLSANMIISRSEGCFGADYISPGTTLFDAYV